MIAGFAVGLLELSSFGADRLDEFVVAAVLFAVAHASLSVELPGGHRLSASPVVLLPLATVLDAPAFVLPALVGPIAFRVIRGESDVRRGAYNVAQLALSTLGAGHVFRLLHGEGPVTLPGSLPAVVAIFATYQFLNSLLVTLWRVGEFGGSTWVTYVDVLTRNRNYPLWAMYSILPVPGLLLADAHGYWGLALSVVSILPAPAFLSAFRELRVTRERMLLDELTLTYNYRYFAEWLRVEGPRVVRQGESVAFVVVDCDDLKDVNDRLGHEAGNAVLRDLAARIRGLLRTGDTIVRFGGDEFVIILPGAHARDAEAVAERLRQAVADASTVGPDGTAIVYSASVGWAVYPDDTIHLDRLFRLADARMYESKKQPRRQQAQAT